jgi:hypothetical protein
VQFRAVISDALRYWEPRRLAYNALLATIVLAWCVFTWPHFRAAANAGSLALLFVLAVLANACYCAAYLVDLPLQYSEYGTAWRRWRWALWCVGTLFAAVLANYWIADEIYPFVA